MTEDEDDFYDVMRDNTGCAFEEDVSRLFDCFVNSKNINYSYYSGKPSRFWEHLKSRCEFELKLLEVDDNEKQTKL
jgi:hypothetical protein